MLIENQKLDDQVNILLKEIDRLKAENMTLHQKAKMKDLEGLKASEELEHVKQAFEKKLDAARAELDTLNLKNTVYLEQIEKLMETNKVSLDPKSVDAAELKVRVKELEAENKKLIEERKKDKARLEEKDYEKLAFDYKVLEEKHLELKIQLNDLKNDNLKLKDRSKSPIGKTK